MATSTGRDDENPEFAEFSRRILQLLSEISSPRPDEPLAFLQWCRGCIESWHDDFPDNPKHKLNQRALTMLDRAERALKVGGDKGVARALDCVWCAAGAHFLAIRDEDLDDVIARYREMAPAILAAKRRSSAKAWAKQRHAELMTDDYAHYAEKTRKQQANRLWRDWAQAQDARKSRVDRKGNVTPPAATFERYLRDF